MFWNVLLLGVAAGLQPPLIAAVAYMLSRERAVRLLTVYLVGGMGLSLIVGVVVLFVLKGVGVNRGSSIPPEIEIAVGALALLIAALVGAGVAGRIRDRFEERRGTGAHEASTGGAVTADPAAVEGPPGMEKLAQLEQVPAIGKLVPRVRRAFANDSPWLAWVAGVAIGMPTPYYLAAIAIVLKAGVSIGTQLAALVVFNVAAFALVIYPLIDYLRAPEATRARIEAVQAWILSHERLAIALVAGVIGAYLLIKGLTTLN